MRPLDSSLAEAERVAYVDAGLKLAGRAFWLGVGVGGMAGVVLVELARWAVGL